MSIPAYFILLFAVISIISISPSAFAEIAIMTGSGNLNFPGCEKTGECYAPIETRVGVGEKVIMTNVDPSVAHTFTSGKLLDDDAGSEFDTGLLQMDQSFEYIPANVGKFPYFCQVHPWMKGMIIVQEARVGSEENKLTNETIEKETVQMKTLTAEPATGGIMDDISATGVLSDGTKIVVRASAPTVDEAMKINIEFEDADYVNYDIKVTQNGSIVLDDVDVFHIDGNGQQDTMLLKSSDPVDVAIIFQGFGIDEKVGPIGEKVAFANVVPEFGTIAMAVLAVAIISIVAVTTKSRVVPRF